MPCRICSRAATGRGDDYAAYRDSQPAKVSSLHR